MQFVNLKSTVRMLVISKGNMKGCCLMTYSQETDYKKEIDWKWTEIVYNILIYVCAKQILYTSQAVRVWVPIADNISFCKKRCQCPHALTKWIAHMVRHSFTSINNNSQIIHPTDNLLWKIIWYGHTHTHTLYTTTAVLLMTKVQAAFDFQLPTFDIP